MTILITVVHVIACFILVLVVLLQAGKGADMGAVFGGASSTIFGSSGAGNFLTRLTTGAAIVFMTTSLALTYVGSHGGHSTIMPETGMPKAGSLEPAADAGAGAEPGAAADSEAAAVADGAPAAAPAEGGAAPVAEGEDAAPAGQAPPAAEPPPAAP
ncbi:MAG: preprotein translocase subunit SecG [Deltaproteobacteria bacterium]|nr:preprotein translocase subunit SecG [Deltaproteobacteria bacterium]